MPSSDIDLVVVPKKPSEFEYESIKILEGIKPYLESNAHIKNVTIIRGASTPVIKLEYLECDQSIKVDISVKDLKHRGIECVKLVQEYVQRYTSLKKLLLVLKSIIKLANLNDPYLVAICITLGWSGVLRTAASAGGISAGQAAAGQGHVFAGDAAAGGDAVLRGVQLLGGTGEAAAARSGRGRNGVRQTE